MIYKRASSAWENMARRKATATLFNGDCRRMLASMPDECVDLVVTSPPYCIGKAYEPGYKLSDFVKSHNEILPEILRVVKPGGSICWQVGYQVQKNAVVPLDYLVYEAMQSLKPAPILRNRIIWTFGHGQHSEKRFSGRHEMILWFTKGEAYQFDLDAVRVAQLYPGKRANRGPKKGELSGNPLGKNPDDVWEIPNVKANHVEKMDHPCQFPVALVRRLVKALTLKGGLVFDPFAGVASTGVGAVLEGRRFIGAELSEAYAKSGSQRLRDSVKGNVRVREDKPVLVPDPNTKVAQRPEHFRSFGSHSREITTNDQA